MGEAWGGIVDDLDAVLLGIFGTEGRPISILALLLGHHYWLVVVQSPLTEVVSRWEPKRFGRKNWAK